MKVCYNKLWKILIDKSITKTELRKKLNLSSATLAKLSKNYFVSMDTIVRICCELNCEINDIVEFKKEINNVK